MLSVEQGNYKTIQVVINDNFGYSSLVVSNRNKLNGEHNGKPLQNLAVRLDEHQPNFLRFRFKGKNVSLV